MRWAAAGLVAAVLLLGTTWSAGPAPTAAAGPGRAIALQDTAGSVDAAGLVGMWLDPLGQATIDDVSRSGGGPPFRPGQPQAIHRIGPQGALWLHLRVQRAADSRQDWMLELPMPAVDHVTLFQREGGSWRADSAGDSLPVVRWAEPGRYPVFRLQLDPGVPRDLYVRIRHTPNANFPVQLSTAAVHSQRLQLESMALGGAFGALLLLIVGCVAKGWVYRDPAFGWYAGYAALTSLAVATYTGSAAHLLWPGFGLLQDAPVRMLACAAVGAALLFVRTILALRRRYPLLDRSMLLLGALGLVLTLAPLVLPKAASVLLVGLYVSVAALHALLAALFVWLRGDPVAKWVLAAYAPMVAAALLAAAQRVFGWLPITGASQYTIVVAMTIEVPLLLVALFIRSRDRHSAQVREQALVHQDALTGLLAAHLFTDRLRQVVARHRRDGESAAVMYIELVNHARIREHFGGPVADQSLLRSVIKLRRLLRDVDTVARVGEARFGVLLEGAGSRSSVTERATRLIAAGLMPLPGLKPDVTLQFHIAAVMLNEMPLEAEEVEQALQSQLGRMSPRTRRPIRFVEAGVAPASDPGDTSMFAPMPAEEGHGGSLAPAP